MGMLLGERVRSAGATVESSLSSARRGGPGSDADGGEGISAAACRPFVQGTLFLCPAFRIAARPGGLGVAVKAVPPWVQRGAPESKTRMAKR